MLETPYSNPIAPQWMYPDWGYRHWCEMEFTYLFPLSGIAVTIPTTGTMNQQLQFDTDSEFHITDWYVWGVDTAQATINTTIQVRLIDSSGKRRINDFVAVGQACGFVPRDWVVAPGGVQRLDFRNTGSECTVVIAFRGFKRFQRLGCPPLPLGFVPIPYIPLWARYSSAPAGYIDEPFAMEFDAWSITAPFVAQQEGIPLPMDTDAPYLIRAAGLTITDSDASSSMAARIVTPAGNRLVLRVNPASATLPYALRTNFGGSSFINTRSRPVYPEIICPAGGVLALDVSANVTAGTSVGTLRLNGVKRQRL